MTTKKAAVAGQVDGKRSEIWRRVAGRRKQSTHSTWPSGSGFSALPMEVRKKSKAIYYLLNKLISIQLMCQIDILIFLFARPFAEKHVDATHDRGV